MAKEKRKSVNTIGGLARLMQEEFLGVNNRLGNLEVDMNGVKTDIREVKTDVGMLKFDMSEVKKDVSEMKKSSSELFVKYESTRARTSDATGALR